MALFIPGPIRLHSGEMSPFKIDCDALTNAEIECVAEMMAARVPPFGSVEGVPTGGFILAQYMRRYRTSGPLLIVDDVLTTGASMEKHRNGRDAIGAVIFSRGNTPAWVTALFQMAPVMEESNA